MFILLCIYKYLTFLSNSTNDLKLLNKFVIKKGKQHKLYDFFLFI